jgi:hypothetical protein
MSAPSCAAGIPDVSLACAPVAQLDRANASGALGREFEPLRAHHSGFLSIAVSQQDYFPTYFDDSGMLFSYLLQWVSNSCSTGEPTR